MASIKNFGLQGVSSDVQFGKGGNRLVSSAGLFKLVDTSNTAVRLSVANATAATDAVALGQLDAAVASLTANAAQQTAAINDLATSTTANAVAQQTIIDGLTANTIAQQTAIDTLAASTSANAVAQQAAIDAAAAAAAANAVAQQAAIDAVVSNVTTAQGDITALYANASQQGNAIAAFQAATGASTDAIQAEIDAIETAIGLAADGTFVAPTGTNYIDSATSVLSAVTLVDAAVKAAGEAAVANAIAQQAVIDSNTTAINGEIARATTAEAALANSVAAEVTRATDAETALATSIGIETIRAQGAEQTIANSVTAEIARATAAEQTIANAVAAEVTRATGVEAELRTDLDDLSAKVTNLGNVFEYKGTISDTDLTKIVSPGIGDYYKVAAAGTYTGANGFSITVGLGDGLVFNGTDFDKIDNTDSAVFGTTGFITVTGSSDTGYTVDVAQTFKDRLTAVENATSVDTADLQDQIDGLRSNAVTEASRQDGVNAAQNEALALEANARQAADALNATAISDETARATAAEGVLSSNLANAVTAYQAADAVINNAITAAAAATLAADAALGARIDAANAAFLAADAVINSHLNDVNAAYQAADALLANTIAAANSASVARDAALSANIASVQAELDATQTGAGLAANGAYVVPQGSNYLGSTTSLADADAKLDAAIKSVQSGLQNLSQDSIQSANTLYSVKTTNSAVQMYGDKGGVKTLFANAVTGAAQDSTITLSTAVAGEVRFEAHSDTATNVDIRLVPQGTGQVVVGEEGTNGVIQADDGYDLTLAGGDSTGATAPGKLVLKGGANGSTQGAIVLGGSDISHGEFTTAANSITIAATGTATDLDIVLAPKGAGVVDAANHKIAHVANAVTADQAVNLGQLTSAVSSAQTAATTGAVRTATASLTAANGSVDLSSLVKGTVLRVKVMVLSAYAGGTTISVGRASAATELATANDIDETVVGIYVIENLMDYAAATQLNASITGSNGTNGAAKVVIEYLAA
jgi:hypothetical protein